MCFGVHVVLVVCVLSMSKILNYREFYRDKTDALRLPSYTYEQTCICV